MSVPSLVLRRVASPSTSTDRSAVQPRATGVAALAVKRGDRYGQALDSYARSAPRLPCVAIELPCAMCKATTKLVLRFTLHKFQRKNSKTTSCLASQIVYAHVISYYAFNILGLNLNMLEQVARDGKFSIPSILLKFFHSYSKNFFELAVFCYVFSNELISS